MRGVGVRKRSGLGNRIVEAALDGTKGSRAALDERKEFRQEGGARFTCKFLYRPRASRPSPLLTPLTTLSDLHISSFPLITSRLLPTNLFQYCVDNPIVLGENERDDCKSEVDHGNFHVDSVDPDASLFSDPETVFDPENCDLSCFRRTL